MFGSIYPLPRILYAMSNDGLIFESLGKVHGKFKTPFFGTMVAGVLTGNYHTHTHIYVLLSNNDRRADYNIVSVSGLFAALLNLKQLVDMMTIGTLLVYVMVAMCVLYTR